MDTPSAQEPATNFDVGDRTPMAGRLFDDGRTTAERHATSPPPDLTVPEDAPPTALPPLLCDRYEVIRLLGRGGMGVVYLVHDRVLGRDVALKMMRSEGRTRPDERARFQREAQALARLNHRHLMTVFDSGEHLGQLFFTMAYAPGGSLLTDGERFRRDPRAAVELVAKIARGLHAAHQQGYVHRDLKPGNVLFDAEGEPLVTDFGLVKLLGSDESLTRTGTEVGTPSHMAPEQVAGRSERVGPATDVWALGVILYELLSGRRPFPARFRDDLFGQILTQDPQPLRGHAVPASLEKIVLGCLHKEPSRRWSSAEQLADNLTAWLAGRPARVPEESWTTRLVRGARRHGATVSLVLLVVCLALAVVLPRWDPPTVTDLGGVGSERDRDALMDSLRNQEPASLVGRTGPPRWYQFLTEKARPAIVCLPDEEFSVTSNKLTLLELLSAVPLARYRFSAELTFEGLPDSEAGLYVCRRAHEGTGGTEHWFVGAVFAAAGREANVGKGRVYVVAERGQNRLWMSHRGEMIRQQPLPAPASPPWHKVAIEVRPESVSVIWGNGPPTTALMADVVEARQNALETVTAPGLPRGTAPELGPHGGLGLCVFQGKVRLRNAVVVPLVE